MRLPLAASLLALVLAVTGCIHSHHHEHKHKGGPPPWAPAHGYRHKHHQHGVDLRFDAHLGVYVVVGHPHVYFHGGHYFRHVGSHWERCGNWKKGRWKHVDVAVVPGPLVTHYKVKAPKHGHGHGKKKGHGHGPAKFD